MAANKRTFRITIDLDLFDDDSEKEEFFIDVLNGKLYYTEDCEDTNYILNLYIENIVENGDIDNIVSVVPDSGCKVILDEMRDKIKSNVEIVEYSSRSPSSIDIRIDDLQKIDDRSTDSDAKTITDEYIENQNLTRQISELSDVGNTSIDDVDNSNTSRIQSLEVDDDVDTSI